MATELQQLLLAVLLGAGYMLVYGVIANLELGVKYTAGPRDTLPEGLSVTGRRAGRALANYLETLPWFAIAMMVAHLAQKVDGVIITAGWVYLAARVLYLPAYLFIEIPFLRSIVWGVGLFAIMTIVIRILL